MLSCLEISITINSNSFWRHHAWLMPEAISSTEAFSRTRWVLQNSISPIMLISYLLMLREEARPIRSKELGKLMDGLVLQQVDRSEGFDWTEERRKKWKTRERLVYIQGRKCSRNERHLLHAASSLIHIVSKPLIYIYDTNPSTKKF